MMKRVCSFAFSACCLAFFGIHAVTAGAADAELFDMAAIRDASTLEVEVIQDWHHVDGAVPTRQKLVTINVGEMWPGQSYRMPVRMVVPAGRKAKGFHLTGGNTPGRLHQDTRLSALEQELIEGGVGLVYTVVQVLQQSGLEELARASEERFIRTFRFTWDQTLGTVKAGTIRKSSETRKTRWPFCFDTFSLTKWNHCFRHPQSNARSGTAS